MTTPTFHFIRHFPDAEHERVREMFAGPRAAEDARLAKAEAEQRGAVCTSVARMTEADWQEPDVIEAVEAMEREEARADKWAAIWRGVGLAFGSLALIIVLGVGKVLLKEGRKDRE